MIVGFKPSSNPRGGGVIELKVPGQIELISRRSYFRVEVPKSLKVEAVLRHCNDKNNYSSSSVGKSFCGRVVDISAGGVQIVIDASDENEFRKGQYIKIKFTPMPYEAPLSFNAQIRTIFPTANAKNLCLGAQIVGLEASSEGKTVLQRLCQVVERYYRMNQVGVKQQDFLSTTSF